MVSGLLKIKQILLREELKVRLFLVIFYATGIAGFMVPAARDLFLKLTPMAILLSFAAILFFHQSLYDKKTIIAFSAVIIGTWGIESSGVSTGIIFGSYTYGSGLGIKFLNTPLLIGLNWLLLIYTTSCITEGYKIHPGLKILISSLLMVLYDYIIENVARDLDMWSFERGMPPVKNYIAWFVIAVLIHFLFNLAGIKTTNRIAPFIFVLQSLFFMSLILLFKFSE
jgi:putative membrane protein